MTSSRAAPKGSTRAASLPRDPLLGTPLRHVVRDAIGRALRRAVASGALPALEDPTALETLIATIEVEVPASSDHGDYASNIAMKSSKLLKRAPAQIAAAIAAELAAEAGERIHGGAGALGPIVRADVAGPGFLNVRLRAGLLAELLDAIVAAPNAWGHLVSPSKGQPTRVNVEFVSANPTGPLTVGNARGAFVGDLLSRVLEAAGQEVTREYYFNDFGEQVRRLGESVIALRDGREVAEDGYKGDYVADLARHPEWAAQPMTVKVEGPLAVGTRYTSDVQFMGHPQGRGQILEVDTPRRFAFDATDSSGHYKWFFNIRPEGSGVNLEYGFDRLAAPLPFTLLQGLVFWPMFGSKWTAQSLAMRRTRVQEYLTSSRAPSPKAVAAHHQAA